MRGLYFALFFTINPLNIYYIIEYLYIYTRICTYQTVNLLVMLTVKKKKNVQIAGILYTSMYFFFFFDKKITYYRFRTTRGRTTI